MPTHTRECPFCGEAIEAEAEVCPYCGGFLEEHPRESTLDDQVELGDMNSVASTANGQRAQAEQTGDGEGPPIKAQGDAAVRKRPGDDQYEIVLHWDGERSLRGFDLAECNLSRLKLKNADLSGTNLLGADLREADLRGANLSKADLRGADLREANLSKADLGGTDLSWADLRGTDLSGADLGESDLSRADLRGANLSWASLSQADLFDANLSKANLNVANLSKANLNMADLSGANLGGAYLGGANLGEANLREAYLGGAYLGGAYLGGASLSEATLKEARVTDEQLAQARLVGAAGMPDGPEHDRATERLETTVISDNGGPIDVGAKQNTGADSTLMYAVFPGSEVYHIMNDEPTEGDVSLTLCELEVSYAANDRTSRPTPEITSESPTQLRLCRRCTEKLKQRQ